MKIIQITPGAGKNYEGRLRVFEEVPR